MVYKDGINSVYTLDTSYTLIIHKTYNNDTFFFIQIVKHYGNTLSI